MGKDGNVNADLTISLDDRTEEYSYRNNRTMLVSTEDNLIMVGDCSPERIIKIVDEMLTEYFDSSKRDDTDFADVMFTLMYVYYGLMKANYDAMVAYSKDIGIEVPDGIDTAFMFMDGSIEKLMKFMDSREREQ